METPVFQINTTNLEVGFPEALGLTRERFGEISEDVIATMDGSTPEVAITNPDNPEETGVSPVLAIAHVQKLARNPEELIVYIFLLAETITEDRMGNQSTAEMMAAMMSGQTSQD